MTASILLDLVGKDEGEALSRALLSAGLSVVPLEGADSYSRASLAESLRCSAADFVLVEGSSWPDLSATLPQPPRSYLIILVLDPEDEGLAAAYLAEGAFDYLIRGQGWEERAASYFRALAALRRRLTTAFGRLERRYESLVHALPDIVYELDSEGRITFINNSIRLLGYEPAELVGRHFSVLLHEDDVPAVDRSSVLGYFEGAKTGSALSPKLFNERRGFDRRTENLELRLKRKKPESGVAASPSAEGGAGEAYAYGEDVIASIISYGEVTAVGEYAQEDGGAAFVGSVGVIRDITLRRKSEEMLRKLYQAVDQLSAGVLVANRDFSLEYVNPAFLRISGKIPNDLIGHDLFEFFTFSPEKVEEIRSLVLGGFDVSEEIELTSARGGASGGAGGGFVAFRASPVRAPSGDVTHASVICEDVSQRRAMEELLKLSRDEAERANRAKSGFLASMSHELKSPAASILAAARLIEMGSPETEKCAKSIIGSAQGLLTILGDILDFVRFESGEPSLRKFVFPLRGFVARTVDPFKAQAAAKGLSLELGSLPDESIYSDPDRLGRALGALLGNAVSFTEKGFVRLDAAIERRGGNVPHLLLSVTDSGTGIAIEDQSRIFLPFVQLASPFDKKGGAGIGLPLARSIVRALGGEIRLESAPGRGSVFSILVPLGEPESAAPIMEGKRSANSVYRLLVVDDNEVNLAYMAAILGNAGHKIDLASSGAEALRLAEERQPDAAIFDIQMPGMSGIELEHRVRSYLGDRFDARLPVLALTAFDAQDVMASGASFSAVFAKPFDANLLLQALDRAVDANERGWFSAASGSDLALSQAAEELPEFLSRLSSATALEDADGFRASAQILASRLEALGAESAAKAVRRLALAFGWEAKEVIDSRLSRLTAAWRSAFIGKGDAKGGGKARGS